MSGPIEQNSSGGPTSPPENPPEITTQEEQEALASIEQVIGDDDSDDDDDGDDDDDDGDDDDDVDFLAELPPSIRGRVEKLKLLNVKRDDFMEGYLKERAALEQKYHALCQPLFDQRKAIINGQGDKEEIQPADDEPENENEEVAGIPEFWNVAMSNIETIDDLVTERDAECLNFLEDITCQDLPSGLGFTLNFHFKPNPYFSNSVLSKRYDVPNLLLVDDEPILKNVTGCEIDWKDPDMCLMHRYVSKKQRNKKGLIRQVKKKERTESFFHFFSPPKLPELADIDEEEAEAIEEAFDHDYDVAQQFRSHIVPKAVLWFTGEAMHDALDGVFAEGDDTLLSSQMEGAIAINSTTNAGGNPFPPPTPGSEEPECKQS